MVLTQDGSASGSCPPDTQTIKLSDLQAAVDVAATEQEQIGENDVVMSNVQTGLTNKNLQWAILS